jgi:DNA-binding LacI/PurR family transcriptional regulator
VNPPMSVVVQPDYEMGVRAGRILIERIRHPGVRAEHQRVELSTTLRVRRSSTRV